MGYIEMGYWVIAWDFKKVSQTYLFLTTENLCYRNCLSSFVTCLLKKFFFNWCLAAPRPTLGYYRGGSLTHLMLITAFLHVWHESQYVPCNEIGSLSPAKHLVGFEQRTFPILIKTPQPTRPLSFLTSIKIKCLFNFKLL